MQLETKLDPSASPSFIVFKETAGATVAAAVVAAPPTQTQSPSTGKTKLNLCLIKSHLW